MNTRRETAAWGLMALAGLAALLAAVVAAGGGCSVNFGSGQSAVELKKEDSLTAHGTNRITKTEVNLSP